MKNEEFAPFSPDLYGNYSFLVLHPSFLSVTCSANFSKKKNRSNLLIIFASRTTDI